MLDASLKRIGLSEKEAKVYLASLELGKSSAQKIAEKAKVNRATTYVILESLIEKGVMHIVEEDTKKAFVALGPYALKNVIRKQYEEVKERKEKLDKLFPKLKKVHNILPNRPVVRFYEGKEAIQSVREQVIESKNKTIYAIYSEDEVSNIFTKEDRARYLKRREEKGIKSQSIYNPSSEGGLKPSSESGAERRAVAKEAFSFPCDLTIFDDHLSISILTGFPASILIESESVAETFRSIFKLAYEAAEKYDKELHSKAS